MGQSHVSYRGSGDNGHRLSDSIWRRHGVPELTEILNGQVDGWVLEDDFLDCPTFATTVVQKGYLTYQDTGVTMQSATGATGQGGVLEVAGNDADNDEGSIVANPLGAPFIISDTAAEEYGLAAEFRIKKASIADNALSFFIGLSEEATAAANALVDDTGVVADKDHIGFSCVAAAGETVNWVYKKAGQTAQTALAAAHTLVADTYVKLGFLYLPTRKASKRIACFVNGVEQSTYITSTNIAAATFPDGEELTFHFATKVGAAAESKAQLDRFRIMQFAVNS